MKRGTNRNSEDNMNQITRAIIVIHGRGYNPVTYFQDMVDASEEFGASEEETLIIAPQIMRQKYLHNFQDDDDFLAFQKWWVFGSSKATPFYYSPFDVIDDILLFASRNFPSLSDVVVAGHSGGGQFVQRYAIASSFQQTKFKITYLTANPSSYAYLNKKRPEGTKKQLKRDCPEYNDWGYGLDAMYKSVLGDDDDESAPSHLIQRYLDRHVVYAVGDRDTKTSGVIDNSCAAESQGPNRYERGLNYFHHHIENQKSSNNHEFIVVPGGRHKQRDMFMDEAVGRILFGNTNDNDNNKHDDNDDDWTDDDESVDDGNDDDAPYYEDG